MDGIPDDESLLLSWLCSWFWSCATIDGFNRNLSSYVFCIDCAFLWWAILTFSNEYDTGLFTMTDPLQLESCALFKYNFFLGSRGGGGGGWCSNVALYFPEIWEKSNSGGKGSLISGKLSLYVFAAEDRTECIWAIATLGLDCCWELNANWWVSSGRWMVVWGELEEQRDPELVTYSEGVNEEMYWVGVRFLSSKWLLSLFLV